MSGDGVRPRRVAEAIRSHVSHALVRDVGDRRLTGLVVTAVDIPADLGVATVSVRSLAPLDDKERRRLLGALERASARIARGLGPALGLKRTPRLRFEYDAGPDRARRVEELLAEIAEEKGQP